MKKIRFSEDVLPHLLAVVIFLLVTVFFFSPVFFENKSLSQHDIQQFLGSSKDLRDYRDTTGEEGLWASSMFSGMPAYLVSIQWSDGAIRWIKTTFTLFLPHPVNNIFLAFLCYYILLLAFRVRPWLAIGGALAFGLSSFVIIGLGAGHNARIGAIALMPLVVAGIHLAFSGKRILGTGLTALGLSLHLRENHPQITYYLILIVLGYGLVQLTSAIREKQLAALGKTVALLVVAAGVAFGTFFGQFWATTEYSRYSIRGPSELVKPHPGSDQDGLSKSYAFEYSNGLDEPMTLIIPNFLGGSTSHYFVQDENSETYKALSSAGDNQLANQLVRFTGAYWGTQFNTAPYYAGAVICFLFVAGILFADRKYVWWLVPLGVLGIMLSWGSNFSTLNYFLFDHFPGYNKFRSVTFALIIILFAMPLLGMLGLEKFLMLGVNRETRRKWIGAFAATGGICLVIWLFAGLFSMSRPGESQLPVWLTSALHTDRVALLRSDSFRSLIFISIAFLVFLLDLPKRISAAGSFAFLAALILVDVSLVDKRFFTKENYQRKAGRMAFEMTAADQRILQDKGNYRVYNLQNAMADARTSYFHRSLGGYHGAKMRRYLDLFDSVVFDNTQRLIADVQAGRQNFRQYGGLNMLNAKYIVYGANAGDLILNPEANGNAWFVKGIIPVHSPNEELARMRTTDTRDTAVVDVSRFPVASAGTSGSIRLVAFTPPYLKYESETATAGLAVFSEIYYPKGWKAWIDGREVPILRADYVLRALEVPAGKRVIEFRFEPAPYVKGNKVTMASSWILLLVVAGSLGWSWKKEWH